MIDRSPTDLHDGKTLRDTLSKCDTGRLDGKHTSGNVALMKSTKSMNTTQKGRIDTHFQRHNNLR